MTQDELIEKLDADRAQIQREIRELRAKLAQTEQQLQRAVQAAYEDGYNDGNVDSARLKKRKG